MMKSIESIIICFLTLFFSSAVFGAFYKYVDNKGITHVTDKLSTIPPAYQSQAKAYFLSVKKNQGMNHPSLSDIDTGPDIVETYLMMLKSENSDEPDIIKNIEARQKQLLDKKAALNKAYGRLMAQKKEFEKLSSGTIQTEEDVIRYNTIAGKINEKIKRYKQKEKKFMAELERYNHAIDQAATDEGMHP